MTPPDPLSVHGYARRSFRAVEDAFRANFAERLEVGAAVAAYHHGECVLDLWGGVADPSTSAPWQEDTLALIYSSTKGLTSIAVLLLIQAGAIELDAPVAEYWPEFAANGKSDISVRQVLAHQAGLPSIHRSCGPEEVRAVRPIAESLASQPPDWTADGTHGYHALTFGYMLGEVIERVTGQTVGKRIADIARELDLECWIGLPPSEESRVSTIVHPHAPTSDETGFFAALGDPTSLTSRVFLNPSLAADDFNQHWLHQTEMPAGNGISTARSLARLYAACVGSVDGVRLLEESTMDLARTPQSDGPDRVLLTRTVFGLGFMLPGGLYFAPPSATALGHPGSGGSVALADPEHGLAFAYVMNGRHAEPGFDERLRRLLSATYRCL